MKPGEEASWTFQVPTLPWLCGQCFGREVECLLLLLACHLFSRGAGSERFNLTGLNLAYEEEKKRKTAPYILPTARHLLGSVDITPHLRLVKFLWTECPFASVPQSETMKVKVCHFHFQDYDNNVTTRCHQGDSPWVSRPYSNFLPHDSHIATLFNANYVFSNSTNVNSSL